VDSFTRLPGTVSRSAANGASPQARAVTRALPKEREGDVENEEELGEASRIAACVMLLLSLASSQYAYRGRVEPPLHAGPAREEHPAEHGEREEERDAGVDVREPRESASEERRAK
jgi:hypothetical protein